jgi:two-component system sensor histidine kinase PilS (NtrC family)
MSLDVEANTRPEAIGRRVLRTVTGEDFAWRILNLLNGARLLLGALLLLVFLLIVEPRLFGNVYPAVAAGALIAMLGFGAVCALLLPHRIGPVLTHVSAQFVADLVIITALMHASGGISSGIGGLFVVSVGTLSLLVTTERALLLAALTAFALLFEQSLAMSQGLTGSQEFTPTGILGGVVFTIVITTQYLRRRVVETEMIAEQRGVDLKNLVELNEYIIQHLRESLIVVDHHDEIRLINTSAAKQLGQQKDGASGPLSGLSPELAERLSAWRENHDARKHKLSFMSADGVTRIEPHFAALSADRHGGVLIFLEDTSQIAERVQQTKLAALGRLSASIAHEIRNPLGALSHAGQLLAESQTIQASDHRLTDIICINASRVSHIVDSILSLSRGDTTEPQTLQLKQWVEDFAREYIDTLELEENSIQVSANAQDVEAEMDPTHLHQIAWNLCDNAVKYASAAAGAIAVEMSCGFDSSGRPFVEVADRGAGISAEHIEQIFEPFFTGQPGGTGLGLYISRELCERNGASLRYHPRRGGGSVFRIVFSDPTRWQSQAS